MNSAAQWLTAIETQEKILAVKKGKAVGRL